MKTPRQIADSYGLKAIKSFGQNFLFDLNITRKIAAACGDVTNLNIIEIGPGPGGLTQALLEKSPAKLTAIEFDERAVNGLMELKTVYGDKFEIIKADALNLDLRQVSSKPCAVVGNLPYNISTKLLTNWLKYADQFEFFILMFQKEVGERIAASPDSKAYGRLSVTTQWLCNVEILFTLPPTVFTPAPKISSSVIKITPRTQPQYSADKTKLELVVKTAFNQRRKMLKSSLKAILPEVEKDLNSLNINPTQRAENLSVEEFCKIANLL